MPTTTHTYQASRLQWSNWGLPDDAPTIALAALRDAGGKLDHEGEFIDGEWESHRVYHLDGTQYYSVRVERVSLDEYAVTFGTDPEWEPTHDGFDRNERVRAWLEYAEREDADVAAE